MSALPAWRQGDLPHVFGRVHRTTATPLVATASVVAVVLVLAWFVPFERLAQFTSLATLVVFALVNLALLKLRWDGGKPRSGVVTVPIIVPVLGLLTCLVMIVSSVL